MPVATLEEFISKRERYAAEVSSEIGLLQVGSAAGVRAKGASWKLRGLTGIATKALLDQQALVQVPANLRAQISELYQQIAPTVASAFTRFMVPCGDRAFDNWPEFTGFSKSMLTLGFRPAGETGYKAVLANLAPYAWYVHRGRAGKSWIFNAGEGAAKRIEWQIQNSGGGV